MFAGTALSVRLLVYAGLFLFIIYGPYVYMVVCVVYAYNLIFGGSHDQFLPFEKGSLLINFQINIFQCKSVDGGNGIHKFVLNRSVPKLNLNLKMYC